VKNRITFHVSCVVDDANPNAPSPPDIKAALEDAMNSPMPAESYGVTDVVVTWVPNPLKTEDESA